MYEIIMFRVLFPAQTGNFRVDLVRACGNTQPKESFRVDDDERSFGIGVINASSTIIIWITLSAMKV